MSGRVLLFKSVPILRSAELLPLPTTNFQLKASYHRSLDSEIGLYFYHFSPKRNVKCHAGSYIAIYCKYHLTTYLPLDNSYLIGTYNDNRGIAIFVLFWYISTVN